MSEILDEKDVEVVPDDQYQKFQKNYQIKKRKMTCPEKLLNVTYKDVDVLSQFLTVTGKIKSSKITRFCAKVQKKITKEIKIARIMALLPFTDR